MAGGGAELLLSFEVAFFDSSNPSFNGGRVATFMVLANCRSKSGVWDGLRDVSETGCICECGEPQKRLDHGKQPSACHLRLNECVASTRTFGDDG
jgi:hypothetical protein